MLYASVQAYADAGLPARLMARQMWSWLDTPILRTNPVARHLAATCELLSHATATFARPEFRIDTTTMRGQRVAVHEEIVVQHPFCRLLHFRKETSTAQPQVLLAAPLSGHFATLLRGTIETMLPDHDVYVTDWANARDVPLWHGKFDIDDSIDVIMNFLRFLGPETHVVAVCQPSVTTLAAVSLLAEANDPNQPKSMTLMGGPIDTRIKPTAVNTLAASHSLDWFEQHVISYVPFPCPGAFRRVYPGFLQLAGFLSMNMDRHVEAHREMFRNLVKGDGESAAATRAFYNEYTSVMDLSADFYLDTLKRVFKEHQLPLSRFHYRGKLVTPAAIERTALLVIEGERDDICGIGQTKAARALLSGLPKSKKSYHLQRGAGHYAVFNGKLWKTSIYPVLRRFIRAND
jgi:poly(3-hydroxybutyrate) depolymerase